MHASQTVLQSGVYISNKSGSSCKCDLLAPKHAQTEIQLESGIVHLDYLSLGVLNSKGRIMAANNLKPPCESRIEHFLCCVAVQDDQLL